MTDNHLLYDGDCPFCSNYVQFVRLREAVGKVDLLNAREHPELTARYSAQGYDLNEGMLLSLDGAVYFGADCINRLAMLSTESDAFNKLTAAIFRSPVASKMLYPFLRFGRNLTLRLLGRTKIAS